jgi:hypothetical protein
MPTEAGGGDLIEVISIETLKQRCKDTQGEHYSYTVETPDRWSVVVQVKYFEHDFFGDLKPRATIISFTLPSYVKDDQRWVVMDVTRVMPTGKFWSPDLLSPLFPKDQLDKNLQDRDEDVLHQGKWARFKRWLSPKRWDEEDMQQWTDEPWL